MRACLCVLSEVLKAAHGHLQVSSQLRGTGWTRGTCYTSSHIHQMVLYGGNVPSVSAPSAAPFHGFPCTCNKMLAWLSWAHRLIPSQFPTSQATAPLSHRSSTPACGSYEVPPQALCTYRDLCQRHPASAPFELQPPPHHTPPVIIITKQQQLDRYVRASIVLHPCAGSTWL